MFAHFGVPPENTYRTGIQPGGATRAPQQPPPTQRYCPTPTAAAPPPRSSSSTTLDAFALVLNERQRRQHCKIDIATMAVAFAPAVVSAFPLAKLAPEGAPLLPVAGDPTVAQAFTGLSNGVFGFFAAYDTLHALLDAYTTHSPEGREALHHIERTGAIARNLRLAATTILTVGPALVYLFISHAPHTPWTAMPFSVFGANLFTCALAARRLADGLERAAVAAGAPFRWCWQTARAAHDHSYAHRLARRKLRDALQQAHVTTLKSGLQRAIAAIKDPHAAHLHPEFHAELRALLNEAATPTPQRRDTIVSLRRLAALAPRPRTAPAGVDMGLDKALQDKNDPAQATTALGTSAGYVARCVVQAMAMGLISLASVSWFLDTRQEAGNLFRLNALAGRTHAHSGALKDAIAGGIFLPMGMLSARFAAAVAGSLFDIAGGVLRAAGQRSCRSVNRDKWFHLPLWLHQHKWVLGPLSLAWLSTYYSGTPTLALQQRHWSKANANPYLLSNVIACSAAFGAYSYGPVAASITRNVTDVWGTNNHRKALRLEQFANDAIHLVAKMDPRAHLALLSNLAAPTFHSRWRTQASQHDDHLEPHLRAVPLQHLQNMALKGAHEPLLPSHGSIANQRSYTGMVRLLAAQAA